MINIKDPATRLVTLLILTFLLLGCDRKNEYTDVSIYALLAIPDNYSGVKVGTSAFLKRDDQDRWLLYPNLDLSKYKNLENSVSLGRGGILPECEGSFVIAVVTFKPFSGIYLEADQINHMYSLDLAQSCLASDTHKLPHSDSRLPEGPGIAKKPLNSN